MTTETKRITKDDWWDICIALENHIADMEGWLERNEGFQATHESLARNKELLRRLVNTKLSEKDKYMSFSDWVEY